MVRSPDASTHAATQVDTPEVTAVLAEDVPKRNRESESNVPNIEQILTNLKQECDQICLEHPDNFLFFTKYGGAVTQEKFAADSQTDLDLRLVCFELPDEEIQDQIRDRLQAIGGALEVELYFHSFEKYINGEVGETGETTVLEKIQSPNADEKKVIRIDYPSLLSFYTFATMEYFTEKSDSELDRWIKEVAERYTEHKRKEPLPIELGKDILEPQNIVEAISIQERDVIEWIHVYVEHFLEDFQSFHALDEKSQENAELQNTYISRISKYLVRIAFGVAIIDRNSISLDQISEKYLNLLRLGVHAEIAHYTLIGTTSPSWNNTLVQEIINMAAYIRTQRVEFAQDQKSPDVYKKLIEEMENTLLFIVQQGGGLIRRSEFDDVHDFISEHSVLNFFERDQTAMQRETVSAGQVIIPEGADSDELVLIPTKKKDGTQNGTYAILIEEDKVAFERSKVIVGELGVLLNIPRTTAVVAEVDTEVIRVSKAEIERLFKHKYSIVDKGEEYTALRNYFSGFHEMRQDPEQEARDAQLIYSLLSYFTDEFFQYLTEAIDSGKTFSSDVELPPTLLDAYDIEYLPQCFEWLLENDVNNDFSQEEFDQNTTLFMRGDSAESLYFVQSSGQDGGVRVTFDNGETTILRDGEIVGEDALLPNSNSRSYTAEALPGSKLIKTTEKGFRDATASTDIIFALVDDGNGNQKYHQYSRKEVYFSIGVRCLKRLQSIFA